jgi:hypothetical protein
LKLDGTRKKAQMSKETGNTAEDETVTVMTVPADKAQAVFDFIASITTDDADVSGYSMSLGGIGGLSNPSRRVAGGFSGTLCNSTGGGSDFNCGDNDFA